MPRGPLKAVAACLAGETVCSAAQERDMNSRDESASEAGAGASVPALPLEAVGPAISDEVEAEDDLLMVEAAGAAALAVVVEEGRGGGTASLASG